jgi:hypothetical protein
LTPSQDLNGDTFGYTSTAVSPDVVVVGGLDEFQLQLYGASLGLPTLVPGTFNLGVGIETNFATCAHCVLLFGLDGDGSVSKTFFQQSGTLNLVDVDDPLSADAAASLSTVKLVEVTIAPDFTSTPVPGGQCLTLSNYSFDTAPLVPAAIRRLSVLRQATKLGRPPPRRAAAPEALLGKECWRGRFSVHWIAQRFSRPASSRPSHLGHLARDWLAYEPKRPRASRIRFANPSAKSDHCRDHSRARRRADARG